MTMKGEADFQVIWDRFWMCYAAGEGREMPAHELSARIESLGRNSSLTAARKRAPVLSLHRGNPSISSGVGGE